MSNHPVFLDVDILTSKFLFIFSLFVDDVEMINPWKLQPSSPYGSKVIEIWKFDQNGCSRVKSAILNLRNYCYSHPFILIWVRLRRLKNKPVLWYLRFQVLSTCDRTSTKKCMLPIDNWKICFSSISIDINLSLSRKWFWFSSR